MAIPPSEFTEQASAANSNQRQSQGARASRFAGKAQVVGDHAPEHSVGRDAPPEVPPFVIQATPSAELRLGGSPVSDVSTDVDMLHFQPYVDSVAAFLNHEDTVPPITMSIEGEWGSGKSSFMKLLERRLAELREVSLKKFAALDSPHHQRPPRGHVSFRFNAWRHDKQDAMWAAFALCLTTEIRRKQKWSRRLRGDLSLAISRLTTFEGWLHVLSALLLWSVLLLASASAVAFIYTRTAAELRSVVGQVAPFLAVKAGLVKDVPPSSFVSTVTALAERHAWLAALLLLALGWRWAGRQLGSTLDWKLKKYLDKPDYESHTAFIETFHRDFVKIVAAYAREDRVFVFIDDLDRCDIPRAAELMQAINLMIGEDPHLVFILGMDREKVAAGIAYKYREIAPFLRDPISDPDAPTARHPSAFGYSYLEKFIQVTFRVPRPSEVGIDEFLYSLSRKDSRAEWTAAIKQADQSSREQRRQLVEVHASADSGEVAVLIKIVAPALNWNPRRMKQFINGFRLYAYVASDLGLLDILDPSDTRHEKRPRLTLEQLGKFIAITITWPDLVMDLLLYPYILKGIYEGTNPPSNPPASVRATQDSAIGSRTVTALIARWTSEALLVSLLQTHVDGADGWRYSLEHADLRLLLNISQRENRVPAQPQNSVQSQPPTQRPPLRPRSDTSARLVPSGVGAPQSLPEEPLSIHEGESMQTASYQAPRRSSK